jgi:hypothetical protein
MIVAGALHLTSVIFSRRMNRDVRGAVEDHPHH